MTVIHIYSHFEATEEDESEREDESKFQYFVATHGIHRNLYFYSLPGQMMMVQRSRVVKVIAGNFGPICVDWIEGRLMIKLMGYTVARIENFRNFYFV